MAGNKKKLIHKYILEIRDEDTFEKKLSFRLSRLNVLMVVGSFAVLLIVFVAVFIVFTPVRQYIPGYSDVNLSRQIMDVALTLDSLERELKTKDLYIQNIKNIISPPTDPPPDGGEGGPSLRGGADEAEKYKHLKLERSKEDSLLRVQIESEERYNLLFNYPTGNPARVVAGGTDILSFLFFTPLKGLITDTFCFAVKHYGIDIVAPNNEAVKATLDGTVILATWTSETGYVMGIQHENNLLSIYKHNSVLLKKAGNYVRAGEVIAIIGDSGELTTGPHLHFELWWNGNPLDPEDYMVF